MQVFLQDFYSSKMKTDSILPETDSFCVCVFVRESDVQKTFSEIEHYTTCKWQR